MEKDNGKGTQRYSEGNYCTDQLEEEGSNQEEAQVDQGQEQDRNSKGKATSSKL
jgi:hypothetical protein